MYIFEKNCHLMESCFIQVCFSPTKDIMTFILADLWKSTDRFMIAFMVM